MKQNVTRPGLALHAIALAGSLLLAMNAFGQDFIDGEFIEEGMAFTPNFMKPEELKSLIESGADNIVIVDNAPELAWEEEHIPGAISYPWVAQVTPPVSLPRNKTLVFYCPCNGDDADAIDMATKLRQFGYFNVKILEGGWFKWLELGYPIYERES